MRRLRSVAPYIALGPISGPLVAGVVRSLRGGHVVLAGLYAFAAVETWILLPLMVRRIAIAAGLL